MSPNPSDPPPAYEETELHHQEQPNPEQPLPHAHPQPQPPPQFQSTTSINLIPQPPPPDLSDITLDGTLIYPTIPPATSLYAVSHDLDLGHSAIEVSRLVPRRTSTGALRPNVNPRDKVIYKFARPVVYNPVEIIGQRRSTLPGLLRLKLTRQLLKTGWVLWHEYRNTESMVFRVKPTRNPERQEVLEWQDGCGAPVAIETLAADPDDDQFDRSRSRRPRLQVVSATPLDDMMMDILVTAWCARIWITFKIKQEEEKERNTPTRELVKQRLGYVSEQATMGMYGPKPR